MKNEIDLDKETDASAEASRGSRDTKNVLIKCKRCCQYFPLNVFIVNKFTSKSSYCKFCRAQKQMKSKILKD